jgi:uncharacterized protein
MTQAFDTPLVPQLAKPAARIDALDLLRGIAILGIFLMNTWTMSVPQEAYTNPAAYNPNWRPGLGFPAYTETGELYYTNLEPLTGMDRATYIGIHLFADMKFITTFSILFGAGIVLQAERSRRKGHNPWAVHYVRMVVLLMFGLCHTFGFWYGDILTDYALSGMVLAPCRLLPGPVLFVMGLLLIGSGTALDYARMDRMDGTVGDVWWYKPIETVDNWNEQIRNKGIEASEEHMRARNVDLPSPHDSNDRELLAYRGGWWDQIVEHRFWTSVMGHTTEFLTWTFLRCGGCFLLGMSLHRWRFFHASWPRWRYVAVALIAVPTGWYITYRGVLFNDSKGWSETWTDPDSLWHRGVRYNYYGSLITAFGYLALGVLLATWAANPGRKLLRACLIPIRAVGRTALTCYLLETLIGTTIFYGHGLGYFGYLTRAELLPIVLGTWVFILAFATVWLKFFRQGPLEWFWHAIVYWEWKNPRHMAAGPDASLSQSMAGPKSVA